MNKLVFISGLPRSGSTLLAALLAQNPDFHAGMSSPLLGMATAVQRSLSRANEFSVSIDNATRARVLRGLFESYYGGRTERVVFDTNRVWTAKLAMLLELFPDTRIICCVRPIGEIVQSIEHLVAANPLEVSAMFGFDPEINVYGRVDRVMAATGFVGIALNGLKEAYFGPHSDRLALVSYDRLVSAPGETLSQLCDFIGEPHFDHDPDNIRFGAEAFDEAFGMPGLHRIRPQLGAESRPGTLPPDLAALFKSPEFWRTAHKESRALHLV